MLILWHLPPFNQHINTLTFYGFPMERFHASKSCIGIDAAGFCCARICFSTIVFRWNKPLSFQKLGYWEGQKQSFQCKHFPKCCPPPHTRKWQNILRIVWGPQVMMCQKNPEGGWSEFGMATVGIHPNKFKVFNVKTNRIKTKRILIHVV